MNDEVDNGRLGMWIAIGAALLITLGTVLTLVWRAADETAEPPKATAAAAVDPDALDIPLSGELLGKVFFDIGKADIGAQGTTTVEQALATISAAPTKKVVLSGFHDLSGNPAQNAELAKQRAKAVREVLVSKGLALDRVMLRKPDVAGEGGVPEEARRVEIRLVD